MGGLFSDLQVGKHSTRQSWQGSTKYAICHREKEMRYRYTLLLLKGSTESNRNAFYVDEK